MTQRQPLDVVEELFENEHVKLLFLFKVSLFGTWLTDTMSKTSPTGSVIRAFDLQTGYQLCQGGSFNLARGLMETFIAAGGTFQPQVSIDKIVVEGGRATGIALDRWPHRARLAIRRHHRRRASRRWKTCSAASNCRRPSARSSTISNTRQWTLFGLHHALHESPSFAAAGVRSECQSRDEMESRRRDHAGSVLRASRRRRPAASRSSSSSAPGRSACSIRPRRRPASTPPMPGM